MSGDESKSAAEKTEAQKKKLDSRVYTDPETGIVLTDIGGDVCNFEDNKRTFSRIGGKYNQKVGKHYTLANAEEISRLDGIYQKYQAYVKQEQEKVLKQQPQQSSIEQAIDPNVDEMLRILKGGLDDVSGDNLWKKAQNLPKELQDLIEPVCAEKNRIKKQTEKVYEFEEGTEEHKKEVVVLTGMYSRLEQSHNLARVGLEYYISGKPIPWTQPQAQQATPTAPIDISNVPKEPSAGLEAPKKVDEKLDDFLKRWERQPAPGNNLEQTVAEAADDSKPAAKKTYTDAELIDYSTKLKTMYEEIVVLVNTPDSLKIEDDKNLLKEYGQIVDILAKHYPSSLSKHAEEIMELKEKFGTIIKEYDAKLHETEEQYEMKIEGLEYRLKNLQTAEAEESKQPTQEPEPIAAISYEKSFFGKGRVYVDVVSGISGHFIPEKTRSPLLAVGKVDGELFALYNIQKREYCPETIDERLLAKIVNVYKQGTAKK
jgi:hypothetical protein